MAVTEILCEEKHKNLDEKVAKMEEAIKNFSEKLDEAKAWVTKIIVSILAGAFLIFGSAAIALIVFIVTQLPRIAKP